MMPSLLLFMAAATVYWMGAAGMGLMKGGGVCKNVAGLTKGQLEVCHRYPDVTLAAIHGLQMAVKECQYQFRWHRWNCSNLSTKNRNPQSSIILKRGYRESAFAYAISAAGVAHSVARACSQGKLLECGCEPHRTGGARHSWKWGGCSHNLQFGLQFSTKFLDAREKNNGDIQSRVVLHNNQAGRLAVASNMVVRCKCHGVSGSCELKTCWRAAPDFRVVGAALKERFRGAVMIEESNTGSGGSSPLVVVQEGRGEGRRGGRRKKKKKRRRRPKPKELATSLLYYEKSPNFCERDPSLEVPGTVGRQCHRSSQGVDSCSSLCCGRGYNFVGRRRTDRCDCKFKWCCIVTCKNCTTDEWITVCK